MRATCAGLALSVAAFSQWVAACSSSSQDSSGGADAASDASSDGSAGNDAGASCGPLGCQPDLSDASVGIRANALLGTCAGGPEASCHGGSVGAAGMHLPDTPPNLVNVPSTEEPLVVRVLPGDPEHSYLYWKVTGDPRIDGGRMPLGQDPLSTADIELLRSWIEAGAPQK